MFSPYIEKAKGFVAATASDYARAVL